MSRRLPRTALTATDAAIIKNVQTATAQVGGVSNIEIENVTGLQAALDAKAASAHTHAQSDVTGLVSDLAGKASSVHTHAQSDVTGLVADLAGKASTSHTHTTADITNLVVSPAPPYFSPLSTSHRFFGAANGTAMTNSVMVANITSLGPFVSPATFTATTIRLQIGAAVASSTFQLGVYASGADGWPTGAPLVTTANLSGAAVTELSATISLSITRGTQYWLACKSGATGPNPRRLAAGGAWSIGQLATGTAPLCSLAVTGASWPNFTTNPVTATHLVATGPAAVMLTT